MIIARTSCPLGEALVSCRPKGLKHKLSWRFESSLVSLCLDRLYCHEHLFSLSTILDMSQCWATLQLYMHHVWSHGKFAILSSSAKNVKVGCHLWWAEIEDLMTKKSFKSTWSTLTINQQPPYGASMPHLFHGCIHSSLQLMNIDVMSA